MSEPMVGVIPEFTIGDRLRKARELTGLDQALFADEIGLSRNTVSNYELGRTQPRQIAFKAWSLRTGVPVEWLRTGRASSTGPGPGVGEDVSGRPRQDSNLQPTDCASAQVIPFPLQPPGRRAA